MLIIVTPGRTGSTWLLRELAKTGTVVTPGMAYPELPRSNNEEVWHPNMRQVVGKNSDAEIRADFELKAQVIGKRPIAKTMPHYHNNHEWMKGAFVLSLRRTNVPAQLASFVSAVMTGDWERPASKWVFSDDTRVTYCEPWLVHLCRGVVLEDRLLLSLLDGRLYYEDLVEGHKYEPFGLLEAYVGKRITLEAKARRPLESIVTNCSQFVDWAWFEYTKILANLGDVPTERLLQYPMTQRLIYYALGRI